MCAQLLQLRLTVMRWTVTHQAPLSMGFTRQEDWNGLTCSLPEGLPDPGIKPASPVAPVLSDKFFGTSTGTTWEDECLNQYLQVG